MRITQRFPLGTRYIPSGKYAVHTVVDFHVTRNLAGEIVQSRYVSTHQLCGQDVQELGVPETTIARGLIAKHATETGNTP